DKGQSFLNAGESTGDNKIASRIRYDITGNQLEVKDGLGRTVAKYEYSIAGHKIKETCMDAGTRWTIADAAGQPVQTWNDRGHTFSIEYDALRRVTRSFVAEGAQPAIVHGLTVYGEAAPDSKLNNLRGRTWKRFDQACAGINVQYDFKGNLLKCSKQFAADYKNAIDWNNAGSVQLETAIYESSTAFDALNRPVHMEAPHVGNALPAAFNEIYPAYNEAGLLDRVEVRLKNASARMVFVSAINYNAKGQREEIFYGNNTRTKYTYDKDTFLLRNLLTTRNNGNVLQDLRYYHDPAGNITAIADHAGEIVPQQIIFNNETINAVSKFEYDGLNRLVMAAGREHAGQADGSEPGSAAAFRNYTEAFRYDKAGNMLQQQHIAKNGSWTRDFVYGNAGNQLTQTTTGAATTNYVYDPHGNMQKMEQLSQLVWNFADQLQEVDLGGGGKAYYVYDATGARVRKVIERPGGIKQERLYLSGIEIYRETSSTSVVTLERETLHVMDDKARIAMVDTNGAAQLIRFNYDNHAGSATMELDETAKVITYEEYFPFGTTSYLKSPDSTEVPARRYRYMGKERDEESGLSYYGARYYAPWLCRWTATDPAKLEDGLNLYGFVRNNPVMYNDPDGKKPRPSTPQQNITWRTDAELHRYIKGLTPEQRGELMDKSTGAARDRALLMASKYGMDIEYRRVLPEDKIEGTPPPPPPKKRSSIDATTEKGVNVIAMPSSAEPFVVERKKWDDFVDSAKMHDLTNSTEIMINTNLFDYRVTPSGVDVTAEGLVVYSGSTFSQSKSSPDGFHFSIDKSGNW
ncbi:MAG TPA: RHS repeat-associated core domain-containing protein, partial [Chitinophagaceae bacterium]|nr:RHS repeat-associated core domain-containing protein [Chitinophagaceae bacterium]